MLKRVKNIPFFTAKKVLTTALEALIFDISICSGIPPEYAKWISKAPSIAFDALSKGASIEQPITVRQQLANALSNSMSDASNSSDFEIPNEARKALLEMFTSENAMSFSELIKDSEELEKTEQIGTYIRKILEQFDQCDLETLPIDEISENVLKSLDEEIDSNHDLTGLATYLDVKQMSNKLNVIEQLIVDGKNETIEVLGGMIRDIEEKIEKRQKSQEKDSYENPGKVTDRQFAFVHNTAKISDDVLEGFKREPFPLANSVFSNQAERDEALKILNDLRGKVEEGRIIIQLLRLSPIAALAIGYCFHRNGNNNKLIPKKGFEFYENDLENKTTNSYTIENDDLVHAEKDIDLCVYILANRSGDSIEFDRYVRKPASELNPYIMKLTSINNFGADINLELMANNLLNDIANTRNRLKIKYQNKKINIHLFYNGINELALLIGNQMQRIGPIQLYDYDVDEEDYQKSLVLNEKMFNR